MAAEEVDGNFNQSSGSSRKDHPLPQVNTDLHCVRVPLILVLSQRHSPDGAFADAAKVEVAFVLDYISDLCVGLR